VNIVKKFGFTFGVILVLLFGIMVSSTFAEGVLNDAQRKAIVDVAIEIIDSGNKNRVLRYSQGHRMFGYRWDRVTTGQEQLQLTKGYCNLTEIDLIEVTRIMNEDLGIKDKMKWKVAQTKAYFCYFTGEDIQDTIAFDCSSLCATVYNMTVGTPYPSNAWVSADYSKDSKWFEVTSDMSKREPGDILWKEGHVVVYLGDCYGDGQEYIAEAAGFCRLKKSHEAVRQELLKFLEANPKYIIDHPNYNKQMPKFAMPEGGVMDVTKQVVITKLKEGRFTKVAKYIGPINEGRSIDVTDLRPLNETTSGINHDPIKLPGNHTVVWPDGLKLEDHYLQTSDGYFYKGTPTYGTYKANVDQYNWYNDERSQVMDYVIGTVTSGIKAVAIGWAGIFENVISSILNFGTTSVVSNDKTGLVDNEIFKLEKVNEDTALAYKESEAVSKTELTPVVVLADNGNGTATGSTGSQTNGSTGTTAGNGNITVPQSTVTPDSELDASDSKKKMTIEDVIFNRVPILDINFFDFKNAAGEKLVEGSLVYKIRESIAGWYAVIRNVVLIGMFVGLIYIGIRIATSVPTKKAEYKSRLLDWLVGFIIVFFIHYFMVFMIFLNDKLVEILDTYAVRATTVTTPNVQTNGKIDITNYENNSKYEEGQTSLYESIRLQCYDTRATVGFFATIVYFVLIFLTIRFVILYAKRLFTVAVLIVISPIMGLLYSINKKKYKLGDWGKEFIYNVLLQFIHAVIYTSIVSLAIGLTHTSSLAGGVIALIALNFMLSAEGIFKKIFGFDKAASSGSLMGSALDQLAAYKLITASYDRGKDLGKKAVDKGGSKFRTYLDNKNTNLYKSALGSRYTDPNNPDLNPEEVRQRRVASNHLNGRDFASTNMTNLNGIDYVTDENGVPVAPASHFVNLEREQQMAMGGLHERYEETRTELRDDAHSYALQGLKGAFNSFFGAGAMTMSLPMMVISPAAGLGMGTYGIHALMDAGERRKIEGVKEYDTPKRFTGKNLILAVATGGASVLAGNVMANVRDQQAAQEKKRQQIALLNKQRDLQAELEKLIAKNVSDEAMSLQQINETDSEILREKKEKLNKMATDMNAREFEKALNLILEKVEKSDIKKVVVDYVIKNNLPGLTNEGLEDIVKELTKLVEKDYDIRINEDLTSLIRDEIKDNIILFGNYKVKDKKTTKTTKTNTESFDIRNKYGRDNESTDRPFGTNSNVNTSTSNNENVDVNEGENRETSEKATVHLKEEYGESKHEEETSSKYVVTDEELEAKVDEALGQMKQEELIDVIEKALERKGAVNREITNENYAQMAGIIEELNANNEAYKKLTGNPMYHKQIYEKGKIKSKTDKEGNIEYESLSNVIKSIREILVEVSRNK